MSARTLLIAVMATAGCERGPSEAEVFEAIASANYCSTADDCEFVGSRCPFGCNIYVNEDEADAIRNLLDSFEDECFYKCESPREPECVEGTCWTGE